MGPNREREPAARAGVDSSRPAVSGEAQLRNERAPPEGRDHQVGDSRAGGIERRHEHIMCRGSPQREAFENEPDRPRLGGPDENLEHPIGRVESAEQHDRHACPLVDVQTERVDRDDVARHRALHDLGPSRSVVSEVRRIDVLMPAVRRRGRVDPNARND